MTLGNAAAARARLVVWCKACRHGANPTPPSRLAGMDQRRQSLTGAKRLVCSKCGSRNVNMVMTGAKR
jgi:hypothetical protein